MEGGRVSGRWCMCVVSHGHGVFGWGVDGGGDSKYRGKDNGVYRMSGDAGHFPSVR